MYSEEFDESFDRNKSAKTKLERGIDFLEARAVRDDPNAVTNNAKNTGHELRKFTVGAIGERLWVAIWTYRNGNQIRIISVRRAEGTLFERQYNESK